MPATASPLGEPDEPSDRPETSNWCAMTGVSAAIHDSSVPATETEKVLTAAASRIAASPTQAAISRDEDHGTTKARQMPGLPGSGVPQCAWLRSQSDGFGSVSKVCSGGGEGRVHSSVSAYSFQ